MKRLMFFAVLLVTVSSCSYIKKVLGKGGGAPTAEDPGSFSTATGLAFNFDTETDTSVTSGYLIRPFSGQPDGPNLRFIEGGRTVLGTFEEDLLNAGDHIERTVSVASFFMDETEIANVHWLEYMARFEKDSLAAYKKLEDSLSQVKSHLARYHKYTLRAVKGDTVARYDTIYDKLTPGYSCPPSVAMRRVTPKDSVWVGKLAFNDPYVDHYLRYPGFRFFPVVGVTWIQSTAYAKWRTLMVNHSLMMKEAIASGMDESAETYKKIADSLLADVKRGGRKLIETGTVLPDYRLPTEAEWEYAAQALIGTQWVEELQTHQRIYPWDGHALRNPYGKQMGFFLANFKRGRGDYAGIAGRLNDGALITNYIYEFPPNDYGLYNMAGNVSEWVQDVYRPLSHQDVDDLNPIRRDGFLDDEKSYNNSVTSNGQDTYTSMVSNKSRVYKGGSWKDVAYWMSPGTRRYLDQDSATATIGFRCAMINAGTSH